MAYKQPYNSPNLKMGKEKTMKVRIKPGKEGELSDYAMDHVSKTNKRGKVTIEVPKSEMRSSKSKLFKTSKPKWTSNPNADPPSSRSTAKGFKKQRNKDRVLKAVAGTLVGGLLGGGAAISSLQSAALKKEDPTSSFREGIDRDPNKKEYKAKKRSEKKIDKERKKNTKPQSNRSKNKSKPKKNKACGTGIISTSTCLSPGL
jgi:hypothetical protein